MALLGYNYKAVEANLKMLYLKKKNKKPTDIFVIPSATQLGHKLIQSALEISQSDVEFSSCTEIKLCNQNITLGERDNQEHYWFQDST